MKIIKKSDNKIVFSAEMEESMANAIRRYINQIPVLAVDELEIERNDSILYDETIAHRIGLLPLKSKKQINEKSTGTLKLDVKKDGIVYAEELKGDVEIVYGKTPITILNKGQEIVLTATIKSGKGSEHSKYSPGFMFYRNIFDLKVDKGCPIEIAELCPKNILKNSGGKIIVENNEACDFCEACIEGCEKKGKQSIKISPTKELMLSLESFGQIETKDIFNKSLDALKKDLEEISKKISKE